MSDKIYKKCNPNPTTDNDAAADIKNGPGIGLDVTDKPIVSSNKVEFENDPEKKEDAEHGPGVGTIDVTGPGANL